MATDESSPSIDELIWTAFSASFHIGQRGNLLGYEPDQKYDDRGTPHQRTHVGQPTVFNERPCVVNAT